LCPTLTARAIANVDVETPHDRLHRREIFLVLRGYLHPRDGLAMSH
jgi:hypothetical protein